MIGALYSGKLYVYEVGPNSHSLKLEWGPTSGQLRSVALADTITQIWVVSGAPQNAGSGTVSVYGRSSWIIDSVPTGLSFSLQGGPDYEMCQSVPSATTPYSMEPERECTVQFPSPGLSSAGTTRYTFQQWQDDNTSNPRYFSMPSAFTTYTAQFSSEYLMTVTPSPATGGQVSGGGWYAQSTSASLTATPNPGYLFAGFTGDASGSSPSLTVPMNGPMNVTATFLPIPVTSLTGQISGKSGAQNARQWNLTLTDVGPGLAYAPMIHGVVLTQTYGTACSPMPGRTAPLVFPINFSNINATSSSSATATFDFSGCPANARFTVVLVFTANLGTSGGSTTLTNQTM